MNKQQGQNQHEGLLIPSSTKMYRQEAQASNSFHYTSCFSLDYLHKGNNNVRSGDPSSEQQSDCPLSLLLLIQGHLPKVFPDQTCEEHSPLAKPCGGL